MRYLRSFESCIEILTSLPFCFIFFFFTFEDFWFRLVIMTSPLRLYLQLRVIKYIEADITRELLLIINKSIFLVVSASCYI